MFLLFLFSDQNISEAADGLVFDANLDVQQFLPDVSSPGLAEIQLVLRIGFHSLHIVEDQGECD